MATDQLINKSQGDAIISGLTAIKNAINDQPVPTQVEDVVADAFDVGVSYVPEDYCIYENKLYICDVAHHGAWDGNDFTLTTVGAVLESLNNDLTDKLIATGSGTNTTTRIASLQSAFDALTDVEKRNSYLLVDDVLVFNITSISDKAFTNVGGYSSSGSDKYFAFNSIRLDNATYYRFSFYNTTPSYTSYATGNDTVKLYVRKAM